MKKLLSTFLAFTMLGCSSSKMTFAPINDFDIAKYMGKWYEIARLENSFQKDMINITAQYTLKDNGNVEVINSGYSTSKQERRQAEAIAYPTKIPNHIKVSFFRPFKGDYWIVYVDDDYSIALVSGGKDSLLWILSRTPKITQDTLDKILTIAKDNGYNTSKLIFTHKNDES